MTPPRTPHWANVAEVGFSFGTWMLYLVEKYFGRWAFRVALAPVVLFYVARHRVARQASRQYFHRLGLPATWRTVYRHIATFAETLLDKALAVSGRYPFHQLTFTGREVALQLLESKQGGLLVTAHMGCLEVCRIAAERAHGPKLTVLVHTRHAEQFNAMLQRMNPQSQVKLLQVSDFSPATAALLSARVEAGEFVVIAADRVAVSDSGGKRVSADFLGAPALFPIGPWVLAAALRCPVILFSVVHENNTYRVRFEKLADRVELPRGRREEAARTYVQLYARKLEALCRLAPYDWFNFYPFWETPHE